ncbi:hypothetical protein IEQ34_026732 [Dendrobium chrysotoxum]|uniref:Uncharacterized protein n=1 Tax=Dendrobium chrysotoxum TaxID=161865 RepID=A0AAV7FLB5_DENCH|nr:hypothetical protein IEQ34_026732 [Dendrobium chrysotoxum]
MTGQHGFKAIRWLAGSPFQAGVSPARARKNVYAGRMFIGTGMTTEIGSGLLFRNHISRFSYQIITRALRYEEVE